MARSTRLARPLLVLYALFLLLVLFWPNSDRQWTGVVWLNQLLTSLGVAPDLVTSTRLEVVMNAVIVAPVSLLGSMAYPRLGWRDWTAYGFLASVTVEVLQGLALPGRQASFSDIVANTLGILAGAVLFVAIRPMLHHAG